MLAYPLGRLGALVHAAKRLVTTCRVRMMVTVPLQVIQEDVGADVIAVPAVLRCGALVPSAVRSATLQSVMFEVVDGFEQAESEDGLQHQVRRMPMPEYGDEAPNSTTDMSQALSTSLRMVQAWLAQTIEPGLLEMPRRAEIPTLRGRKVQKLSPKRDDAGSSGVATRTWCPRLCSM